MKERTISTTPGTRRGLKARVLLTSGALLLGVVAPAGAAAMTMHRDRADNTHAFKYDASTGQIGDESSSTQFEKNDPVTYYFFVRENRDGAPGKQLIGKVTLRLAKNRHHEWIAQERVVYDGTFETVITQGGEEVFIDSQDARVVLRPAKGKSKKTLRFFFDLPTSEVDFYYARSKFTTAE